MTRYGISIVNYTINKWVTKWYDTSTWKDALSLHPCWKGDIARLSDNLKTAIEQAADMGITLSIWESGLFD
jgi:hypothetical protein